MKNSFFAFAILAIVFLAACGDDSSSSASEEQESESLYDCAIYDCFTTEYLNQEMLEQGLYGELLDERDGQVYRTVSICDVEWMAQNLNYEGASGKHYCYDGQDSYCEKYGRLYTRAAVSCPAGWHLPDDSEWEALFKCVGGQGTASNALRASSGWTAHPELDDADAYGFSALPGGVYHFGDEGNTGWFLSATGHNDFAVNDGESSHKSTATDYTAISARCVKD